MELQAYESWAVILFTTESAGFVRDVYKLSDSTCSCDKITSAYYVIFDTHYIWFVHLMLLLHLINVCSWCT